MSGVDWQMKGEKPLIIFHLNGVPKRRVTMDSEHAVILMDAPDEESVLLRLHTGEVPGEVGKFLGLLWSIALVVMTYTDVRLYLQMYQIRKKQGRATKWWQWLFWMFVLECCSPSPGEGRLSLFDR